MNVYVAQGLMIPFLGTALGSACALFLKGELDSRLQQAFTGFAAGVMVAASIWSLLIPSMDQSSAMGKLAFIPAVVGFCGGMLFLLLLDNIIPHLHVTSDEQEGPKSKLKKTTMMVLAVTLHNIPEGMAVGVVYAGMALGHANISASAALALALGIAIQNFPEGAIISLPLCSKGMSKWKATGLGVLTGVVEPLAGFVTVLLSSFIIPVLPYLLSFAAGAMMYVVVEELVPEMSEGEHSHIAPILFMLGFSLMMVLDVALG